MSNGNLKTVDDFLKGRSAHTLALFHHLISNFSKVGQITLHPGKTMIGIANGHKRIAWITQLGKNFIHVVFPFKTPYPENLCFVKIARVPGEHLQFNHHFRMLHKEDLNEEVMRFMELAYTNH